MEYPSFGEHEISQSYELFPHLTVIDNITLAPVKVQKQSKSMIQRAFRRAPEGFYMLTETGDKICRKKIPKSTDRDYGKYFCPHYI